MQELDKTYKPSKAAADLFFHESFSLFAEHQYLGRKEPENHLHFIWCSVLLSKPN